ncbi:diacylglycerol/polyprenol kinase family protein [Synechococcus sp. A15-127]|uniref:diacylglycerol/polyprenol kinase family protein n=1 Tax=Synechococcus sp. A15-127 TaxID=1050624 RepID=UPI00351C45A9
MTTLTLINHRWRLLKSIEDIGRRSFGTSAYGLSITLLVALLWPERADAVTAGILVMGIGDGCAGLIGRRLNSPRWTLFGQTKSLAGTVTMAIASGLCLIVLALSTQAAISVPTLLLISGSAVVLEQISFAGIDNLSVPIGVALLWQQLIR